MARTIDVSTPLQVSRELALVVFRTEPRRVVADSGASDPTASPRADLRLDVQAGGVHQQVDVELGALREAEGEVWMPIRWTPVGGERLLPTFVGVLELRDDEGDHAVLALHGEYDAPLGAVGRFGDAVLGRRVAQRSLSDLVARMAERVDDIAKGTHPSDGWRPAAYPVSLRESDAPLLR
jgi:hypothetical protein